MHNTSTVMQATGGREASRERRARLVQGKTGLPPAAERTRAGKNTAILADATVAPAPAAVDLPQPVAPAPASTPAPAPVPAPATRATPLSGRAASRARRDTLVQGQSAITAAAPSAAGQPSTTSTSGAPLGGRAASRARRASLIQGQRGINPAAQSGAAVTEPVASTAGQAAAQFSTQPSRDVAQAVRAARARNGRGDAPPARPSGRVRKQSPIQYAPKVAQSRSYGGQSVTGVRIGRGLNVTGDEPGAGVQVTGDQYVGTEGGFSPREFGTKVGAARTSGGQVVTGSQVRSQVMITGDESNPSLRITGEADQELGDDLLERGEQGTYAQSQFQRQNNPHGHSVFGTNLGRSITSVGSRARERGRVAEVTDSGQAISGTAVGRSVRVTGDEAGSCRYVTGDQYLTPAQKQALCAASAAGSANTNVGANARPEQATPMTGTAWNRPRQAQANPFHHYDDTLVADDGTTVESESWTRQRITGVDVEHNEQVTGDEPGACSPITGTPYVGPGQYEAHCDADAAGAAADRATPGLSAGQRITGDTPLNVDWVTGTQRGAEQGVTGTPYYRADVEEDNQAPVIERVNSAFSVRSPQRESHLRAGGAEADAGQSRITGSFAVGEGKITGNQEFNFRPRPTEDNAARMQVTGEGRVESPSITGSAWDEHAHITGTEGYIAAERNPSERSGRPHGFASSARFKGKGNHRESTHTITGMVGWSPKTAARVTVSGGAQG